MNDQSQILSRLHVDQLSAMQTAFCRAAETSRHDLLLLSPTGSGKTLAFLLAAVQKVDRTQQTVQVVIVSPTRELALQTAECLRTMQCGVTFMPLTGGRSTEEECDRLSAVHPQVLIVTPGRLCHHLRENNVALRSARLLIVDEYDKCLELGFTPDMLFIKRALTNRNHRTWLISASRLADDAALPSFVATDTLETLRFTSDADEQRIAYRIVRSPERDKLATLSALLDALNGRPTIVFVAHRESAERVFAHLKREGRFVSMYHGGMEQADRERALFKFRCGTANVLISTDLAARGLDIVSVECVVNYHLPSSATIFEHRNGRSTRWISSGESYTILGPDESLPEFYPPVEEQPIASAQSPANPEPEWEALYIGRGKDERLSRADIVGYLCKQGGIEGCDIGLIDVARHQSYVAVRRTVTARLLSRIAGTKIKGMKTIVERMK